MENERISHSSADRTAPKFRMIDVGEKEETQRRAVAQGRITLSRDAFFAIKKRTNPKGDVLALAEIAGIMAAKQTSLLIPLCHPIPIDSVHISHKLIEEELSIELYCEVSARAKTGVEMEAITGVNGALLTIYDLSKIIDPVISISDIRLNIKEGGKSGVWNHPGESMKMKINLNGISAHVITLSDRASSKQRDDLSGPLIVKFLEERGAATIKHTIIPDDAEKLKADILDAVKKSIGIIITTGGTGIGPRDITAETIEDIAENRIDGIGELLRYSGAKKTDMSWLSRSGGWIKDQTIIIALPGSPKAVSEGLEAIENIIPHALRMLKGGGHE